MSFHLNLDDITRILANIKIAERHVESGYAQLTDEMGNPLGNLVPFGLRTVSGQYNNLVNIDYGSSDQLMPRLLTPDFNAAEINPRTGQPTSYTQTSGSVYDSQPRTISNLISDQSVNNPAAFVAAFTALGSADPYGDAAIYAAARQAAEDAAAALQELQANIDGSADVAALQAAYDTAAQGAVADRAAATAAQGVADGLNDGASADLATAQQRLAAAVGAEAAADTATAAATQQWLAAQAAQAAAQTAYDADAAVATSAQAHLGGADALLAASSASLVAARATLTTLTSSGAAAEDIARQQVLVDQLVAAEQLATLMRSNAFALHADAATEAAASLATLQAAQAGTSSALAVLGTAAAAENAAEAELAAAQDAVAQAQQALTQADADAAAAQQTANGLDAVADASEAAAASALAALQAAQGAAQAGSGDLAAAQALADSTAAAFEAVPAQLGLEFDVNDSAIFIPNVMPDLGDTAPFNSFLTLFGQFFDHGLDLVSKGGSGTVYIPLQPDDPLYVAGSQTNFMVLTRATNQPGADGVLGTADDIREHRNETTPYIDLNQVYTSHESHQVFLREYVRVEVDGATRTVATGRMLEGQNGGPPTWSDIKAQAREMLGIELSDMDVLRVPLVATDLYGNFQPGANGYAQLVTATGLVEGSAAAPAAASTAIAAGRAFLNDIAHDAVPGMVDHDRNPGTPEVAKTADSDSDAGNAIPLNAFGVATTYDNEMLDKHYVVGDGRGNENIGLTAVHHVFHSEHNNRVEQIKDEILESGDLAFINQWLLTPIAGDTVPADTSALVWDGERLFQASRFSTEMVYQHLVFEEFARLVSPDVDPFVFSNTVDIDPGIVAEFAHVVYRFGHSMLRETVDRLAADGQTSSDIGLIEAFLNPIAFEASGPSADAAAGAILRGMSRQVGNEIDEFLTEALRNNLVGLPLDLGAINIARGRDTGVPSLNEARRQFHEQTNDSTLQPYGSWYDFALAIKNPASIINFIAAYGTHGSIAAATTLEDKRAAATLLVMGGEGAPADRLDFLNATGAWSGGALGGLNDVDFWIGGLAEKKMPFGGQLGTTFNFVFEVQMEQLQDGDRFYYLSRTQGMNLLNQLEADSFSELVMRNTDLGDPNATHLPSSLFLTPDYILELDQARQKVADPNHTDPILAAFSPMVIRRDTNGDGVDDYLRYTGGDHVVIGGNDFDNTLIGGEGDDTLWGDGGNDRLEGGFGVDHLFGGDGDDVITDSGTDSGAADVIHGDAGNDVINGGNGLDLIFGGSGQDFIFGGVDGKTITAGEGNDFVRAADGLSFVAGNEGDDWLEGGDSFDTLAGENSELFFNSPIIGHDVLNGRGNDNDYDAESGDDIMFQGLGIQRNNGMAGFDWAIHKGEAQGANSDLGIPIFVNQEANILRDRFDLVEGLSGWVHADTLTGRDVAIGAYDEAAGAAAQFNPNSPFESYANALLESGVARIAGLSQLVAHLGRVSFNVAGQQHTAVVFDEAAVQRDAAGNVTTLFDTAADILLGGGGSDILQGKAGNDIIDGDRWLNVRIRINDAQGNEIGWTDDLGSKVYSPAGLELYNGRTLDQLMFDRTLNPGQLSIVREILDGDLGDTAVDKAIFRGNQAEYEITYNADGSVTVAHVNPDAALPDDDGTDRLFNIETLVFADGEVSTRAPDIVGTAAADILTGDGRADRIFGLGGNDQLFGLGGNDLLDGGNGNDILQGGEGNDTLLGGAGNDTLDGGSGNDTMTGGAGNDSYVVDSSGDVVTEEANGGTDTVRTALAAYVLGANVEHLTFTGSGDFVATGNELANTITGGAGNDTLDGGAGIDRLVGGAGNDTYIIDPESDVIVEAAGGGIDTALYGGTNAFLLANNVENLVYTAASNANLSGNGIANQITAGAGNDTVNAGGGDDTVHGGGGNDTLFGGGGNDTLFGDAGDDMLFGEAGNDTLEGGEGNDTIYGGDGADQIQGGAGDDILRGDAGNDVIAGGAGNDTIDGGAGNDRVTGGAGNDTMDATLGTDIFVFGASFGSDVVTGFTATGAAQDRLNIAAFEFDTAQFNSRVAITDLGADTLVTINGIDGGSIRLVGVADHTTVTIADFQLV
ncbi:peroxidase family protein [Variovorax saccharolyticus]|uniref:peroxidase family protein n=1 Tax=Variovorax saccharolyticus TaxID=3053516 RepID=UPI002575647E|nr:peroxidase family protein [Variovorax sp. J31P216]MDM0025408.1 peroxidase family protein [Variovorax sp. J31P216]